MSNDQPAAPAPAPTTFRQMLYSQLLFGMAFVTALILFVVVAPESVGKAVARLPFPVMALIFIGCRVTKYRLASYQMARKAPD